MNRFVKCMLMLMVLSVLQISLNDFGYVNAYAKGAGEEEINGNTQWYDNYDYTLDSKNGKIILEKYKGKGTSIVIPGKAVIDGVEYKTKIDPFWQGFWPTDESDKIKSITFTGGVVASSHLSNMFMGCSGLTSLDLSGLDTTNVENMSGMFYGCSGLTSLDLSPLKTDNVTNMDGMFYGCSGLTSLDLSPLKTDNVTNMGHMFYGCSGLTSLDLSPLKTDNVTDMGYMFGGCSGLTSLDLSPLKTDNVTFMDGMFGGCSGLTSLDLSPLKTDNVTFMGGMFSGCSGLTSLDLSPLKTDKVTAMGGMFSGCSGLTSLDLSPLKTDNVTDMGDMFYGCSGLTGLDLSPLKTDNVTNMYGMFGGCSGLTSLDLSPFDISKVTTMDAMFDGCSKLNMIKTPMKMASLEYGGELPCTMYDVSGNEYSFLTKAPTNTVLRSNVNDFTEEERKGSTSSSGKDNTSSSGKDNTSSSGKDSSSSSERKDSSSSSGKDNSSSSSDKVLPDKVPLASDTDFYASSKDNFAPVATSGKITKLTLDFTKVDLSSVDPGKLNMTAIKGSKFTVGDIKTATGRGVKVKVNKKKSVATVTAKKSGQADFETSDGKKYTVRFTVEAPKAQKGAKKIGIDPTATKILTIRDMFGTDIDGGKLSIVKEKVSGQAVVDSTNNTLTVTPKEKDTIKILYQVLNKKYKLTIKVK
ncbi:MAG: BspA family leucine-rich repeat surface protein [Lachnospiraceae bacterium]|nr:BspA family leucine-rich repeat surface protein [Lachnospiraceae bacterium]